ncbi:MAG TPA: c-type cytochrome, partial [Thermoanaerobaculia bacterium]|nr:c-type cytochrome [Thermoanaerobaculia bacterium]
MKPQEPIPHNYAMSRLNAIFAISSLVLLAATGGIVFYDYVRGWKWFQMEFMRMQRERIEQELQVRNDEETRAKLAELDQEMKERQAEIARDRQDLLTAQRELESWEGRHYAADQDFRFAKALLDAKRYELEAAIVRNLPVRETRQREFDELSDRLERLNLRLQQVTRDRDVARARVDQWLGRIRDVENRRKELTAEIDLLRKQRETATRGRDFFILNAPMLDFINPTMKVEQVVLNDLYIDMNYMSVPRVDRCMTCHQAIERPGFESKREAERQIEILRTRLDKNQVEPAKRGETEARVAELERVVAAPREVINPFRTHPRLETFVGSASPHPLLDYGCTVCHRGQDRATEFSRAGHTPASGVMERRWAKSKLFFFPLPGDYQKRNYGFAVNRFLETPMYPRQHYEAGCLKCHAGQMAVVEGSEITTGMAMVELYGCHSCHKIDNWRFTGLQKPGPNLDGIAEKTTPEWAFRWIADPQAFRATTRMPHFFYERNMVGPAVPEEEREENIRFNDAEIHAIVAYLFSNSTNRQWQGRGGGDAGRGKQIVENVGCLGCHIDTETVTENGTERKALRTDFPLERHFGFNLTGTGTKTNPGWLYNWVKNPKNYDPQAPMPDLRLSDQEAADVTAYLMSLQKPEFMQAPIRPPDPGALRGLAKSYMVNTLTDRDAEARLDSMSEHEQLVFLGQRSIEKYGCYSCHDMKGFEILKPIGTELTQEGSKNVHLFDFGFAHDYEAWDGKHEHIIHTVPSWIYNKIRSPRVYDDGRSKPYNDKLKMPNFRFTPEEARLITTVVVGLTKERVSESRLAATGARERLMEEGRKLVSQRNCRGCHVVDGYGRAIASLIEDTNFQPPDLSPQGARTQSPWLFNFLKDPTVMKIRPWMNVRMPTFHFTDEETNRLVEYFAAAGQAPLFDTTRFHTPPARNVAIGQEVYAMLRCAQCHSTAPVDPANPPVPSTADTTSLAPNLALGRIRLRHDWIADWTRRPDEMIPGTRMPTNFPRSAETGSFTSPLGGNAIDTPAFAASKARLLPHFQGEEELRQTMADAVALTNYLRDYIWSIGITSMREPRPEPDAPLMTIPGQLPRTPPPTPLQTGEA